MTLNDATEIQWFDSVAEQNHRKEWVFGYVHPLIAELGYLPVINHVKAKTGQSLTSLKLIKLSDGTETDILIEAGTTGLSLVELDNYDVIQYSSVLPLGVSGLEETCYYLEAQYDGITKYSEVFQFCADVSGFVKIEFWHRENYCYGGSQPLGKNGEIVYVAPFKSRIYLDAKIGRPSYQFFENVITRDGRRMPIKQGSYKLYRFFPILAEFQLDAIRHIRHHDRCEITQFGKTYEVDEFIMNDPQWVDDRGDIATIALEFKTQSTLSVTLNGAIDNLDYEPTAGSCVATVHNCVGLIQNPSDNYSNFEYVNQFGNTVGLEAGDKVIIDSSGFLQVFEYVEPSAYSLLSTSAANAVFNVATGEYYSSVGSDSILLPAINFYNINTGDFAGVFLPGAVHSIFAITGMNKQLIGSYTYQELAVDGVTFNVPAGTESLQMEIQSAACGIFQETAVYEINQDGFGGDDQPRIGTLVIGVDRIGYV